VIVCLRRRRGFRAVSRGFLSILLIQKTFFSRFVWSENEDDEIHKSKDKTTKKKEEGKW
jgi:hypothetical protein